MTILSGIILISTFLGAIVKPIRVKFIGWIRKKTCAEDNEKQLTILNEQVVSLQESAKLSATANCSMLRHHITDIYYRYLDEQQIPAYEKENLIGLFDAYCALKGNHYVEEIVREIMLWDVVKKAR